MKHEFSPIGAVEFFSEDDDLQPPKHGRRWGNWTYDGPSLMHQRSGYEVDLDRCVDAATTMDWILQVADKNWRTTDDIGNLVLALYRTVGYRLR